MMERALKERIIGAVVLVTFVVLIVPIFLDGPPEEGEITTERVLLPGQEDQDVKTVVLDRERSEPIPVANGAAAESETDTDTDTETSESPPVVEKPEADNKPEPQAVVAETSPVVEKTPEPEPAASTGVSAPAASATGMWAVQLGSFSNKENAEKLAADLRKQGYAAFLSQLSTSGGQLHRVRIGPQKDRAAAEEMAARLAKVGHKGQVLPHP